jgi:hypothetical protein
MSIERCIPHHSNSAVQFLDLEDISDLKKLAGTECFQLTSFTPLENETPFIDFFEIGPWGVITVHLTDWLVLDNTNGVYSVYTDDDFNRLFYCV